MTGNGDRRVAEFVANQMTFGTFESLMVSKYRILAMVACRRRNLIA